MGVVLLRILVEAGHPLADPVGRHVAPGERRDSDVVQESASFSFSGRITFNSECFLANYFWWVIFRIFPAIN